MGCAATQTSERTSADVIDEQLQTLFAQELSICLPYQF